MEEIWKDIKNYEGLYQTSNLGKVMSLVRYKEIWKDIKNYEGLYQVSNWGRVKSLDRWVIDEKGRRYFVKGMILKPRLNHKGYLRVGLCKNGKRKFYFVHRLVYEAFIGEIPEGMQVNHKDENKQNNILSNIDTLMTCKENCNWGTGIERSTNNRSKSVIQKTLQGEAVKIWPSASEVERQLGYAKTHISACCRGRFKQMYGYLWQYTEEKATA